MTEPTFCSLCDHVDPDSRKRSPRAWLCSKFPRLEGMGFVSPDVWADDHLMRCVNINGGKCPLFKPRRTAQMEMATDV